jgi:hydrogenase 3 maturation protease
MPDMLLGIGNPLHGDDGAGNYVAARFRKEGWLVLDCGTAPENFTGVVRKNRPDLLVLVDAADMGLPPGEARVIPPERIEDVGFGTHQLPLDQFISFIGECAGRVLLIGIQPDLVGMGEGLGPDVQKGADRLMKLLRRGDLSLVPVLEEK